MRIRLLSICFCLVTFLMTAQLPFVSTVTVIPQNPTASSFIKIVTKVTPPNQGIVVDNNTFTITGQQITIKGCYWQGMLTATQSYIDTLMIGQLPLGNYQVIQKAYLSSTQQHCSKIDSNIVTSALQLNSVTDIAEKSANARFYLYPNPCGASLFIGGISEETEVSVFTLSGELIKKEMIKDKSIDMRNLSDGFYFIKISDDHRTSMFKFLKLYAE